MNIWIFNHYAQGPNLPGGTRHFDMAKELISQGHSVTIIASGYHHVLLKDIVNYEKGYKKESIDKVDLIWLKTIPYTKNNVLRLLNIISYYIQARRVIPQLRISNPDIIIGSSVHPFAPLVASYFSSLYKIPFIFEIRDLWPETFIDMKVWKSYSIKAKVFKLIERLTVKSSAGIITLSPLTQEYLHNHYDYNPENILYLPNGVNDNFIRPVNQTKEGPLKISYVGGIDSVHGLDFIVDLALALIDDNIVFNMYGEGKERVKLEQLCKEKRVTNIFWHGSISKSEVPDVLAQANLLLLSTANVLYGSENKLYEYMAAAKPIIVASKGEHNNPLSKIECGLLIDKDDIEASANKLRVFIKGKSAQFETLGLNAQDYVLKYATIKKLVKKLEIFLRGFK